jgi:hypothetical protein
MKTTNELIQKIESEINMTGQAGLAMGTLIERLAYAEKIGRSALKNLQVVYESTGNDVMADVISRQSKQFDEVLA